MAEQNKPGAAAAGRAADRGYGKIDKRKERDITTEVGKSKGRENNSGDFGNGNDGATGATGEKPLEKAVASIPAKERAASATRRGPGAKAKYPA